MFLSPCLAALLSGRQVWSVVVPSGRQVWSVVVLSGRQVWSVFFSHLLHFRPDDDWSIQSKRRQVIIRAIVGNR